MQRARTLCKQLSRKDETQDKQAYERSQPCHMFQMQGARPLCKQLSRKDGEQIKQAYGETQPWPMSQEWKPRTPCKSLLREVFPGSQEGQYVIFVWIFFKGGSTLDAFEPTCNP